MIQEKCCLTIIDMQRDFLSQDGYYAKKSHDMNPLNKIKDKIIRFLPRLSEGYPIIYVISEFKDKQFGYKKSICVKGTRGCNLLLDKKFAKKIIIKNDLSAFSAKKYFDFLYMNKIRFIILMGVLTEYCIKETALDALRRGFEVIVIEDCIATGGDEKKEEIKAISELKDKGIVFYKLKKLLYNVTLNSRLDFYRILAVFRLK